jgi:hypothetical protein
MMKQGEKTPTKKMLLSVHIGGKKKPVIKEALVCCKSGKVVKFLEKAV